MLEAPPLSSYCYTNLRSIASSPSWQRRGLALPGNRQSINAVVTPAPKQYRPGGVLTASSFFYNFMTAGAGKWFPAQPPGAADPALEAVSPVLRLEDGVPPALFGVELHTVLYFTTRNLRLLSP